MSGFDQPLADAKAALQNALDAERIQARITEASKRRGDPLGKQFMRTLHHSASRMNAAKALVAVLEVQLAKIRAVASVPATQAQARAINHLAIAVSNATANALAAKLEYDSYWSVIESGAAKAAAKHKVSVPRTPVAEADRHRAQRRHQAHRGRLGRPQDHRRACRECTPTS
jgi:hypothetical protein